MSRTLIGCPNNTAERQKIGFDPIANGTAATAQRNFSHKQRNSYGTYVKPCPHWRL